MDREPPAEYLSHYVVDSGVEAQEADQVPGAPPESTIKEMHVTTRVVVVSAGLRSPSSTKLLADQIGDAVEARLGESSEVTIQHVEVREHAHAIADALLTGFPTGDLKAALSAVAEADALVLVSPTFQASFSGLFKSFIDLVDADDVRGTPVLLAATGGSERHSLVIDHALRPLAAYLGLVTVPTGVYAATSDFGAGTEALAGRIDRAVRELVRLMPESPEGTGRVSVVESAQESPVAGVKNFVSFDQLLSSVGQ